jgi:hypothetical protein
VGALIPTAFAWQQELQIGISDKEIKQRSNSSDTLNFQSGLGVFIVV